MNTACFLTRFLYTNEINELAKNNFFLKKFFLGCFPANHHTKNNFITVLLDLEYR